MALRYEDKENNVEEYRGGELHNLPVDQASSTLVRILVIDASSDG